MTQREQHIICGRKAHRLLKEFKKDQGLGARGKRSLARDRASLKCPEAANATKVLVAISDFPIISEPSIYKARLNKSLDFLDI